MILGAEPVTRRRYAAGSRNSSGQFVSGASTDTTIYASVQPASAEEMALLPEGERTREGVRFYTTTELRTASQSGATLADRLRVDGVWFEVHDVSWERSLIPHFRGIALRIQEGTS